jgi:hypothetical protein
MAEVYTPPHTAHQSDLPLITYRYKIEWFRATFAGVAGALALLAFHFFIYLGYGSNALNLPLIFGYFLTSDYVMAQVLGFGITVGLYVGAAWAYAFLLWVFHFQSNGGKGTVYGFLVFVPLYAFILPWTVGLCARWGLPHVNSSYLPLMDVMLHQAGQGNVGWEAVSLVAAEHLLYGLIVGTVYRHTDLVALGRFRQRYLGDYFP